MTDILASKGERDRCHIAMHDKNDVRRWTRHLGISETDLELAVAKVGNSVAAVRKQIGFAK
jgi:Protein of unknown function (DUF3606)